MLLRTAAFLRAAAHPATAARRSGSGGTSIGGSSSILNTTSHGRLPGGAAFPAPFSSSSSSSSSNGPPTNTNTNTSPQQPPSRPRRPSPRRGGGGRSGSGSVTTKPLLPQSSQLPLDLPSYRHRLAQATDPVAALTTLDEMHRAGLSFDAEAALLTLRLCTQPRPTTATSAAGPHHHNHLRDALRLLRRLAASTSPNSPIAHAAYALTLAGCLRGAEQTPPLPHESVLAAMRRQRVRPTVGIYQEVARACLEPAGGSGRRQRAPLDAMRAVLEMDPWVEEGDVGMDKGRLSVRCQDAGEAAWMQAQLEATGSGSDGNVDAALTLLATGLQSFAFTTAEGSAAATPAVAFACNLVLAACIRQARWAEASAVDQLMRGLRAPPDAWAVNALLARALMEGEKETTIGIECSSKGLAASRLLQGLLAAHPTLRPSASAYAAVLKHGGCDALLDLLAAMQRIRGPGAVPACAYRMLLRALDAEEEGRLVAEGLPLVAHADA